MLIHRIPLIEKSLKKIPQIDSIQYWPLSIPSKIQAGYGSGLMVAVIERSYLKASTSCH